MNRDDRAEREHGERVGARPPGTGLEERIAGPLCYLLGFVTGILFLILEQERTSVRFHAYQSIALSVVWCGLSIGAALMGVVPIIGLLIEALATLVLGFGGLALWIYLMWQAYHGREVELPWVGPWAREQADREAGW